MKNRFAVIAGLLVLGLSAMTSAQTQEPELTSGVARISLIHGDVSTQRGDSGDWATAALNQPMVSSDKISTGVSSRTEVQLDHGNILRLGDNTLASIATLSRTQVQIQLDRGLIDYSVFKGTEAGVEIDTANVSVHPAQRDGIYRIEVNAEGETQVIIRKGSAEISTPQGSTNVEKGQMVIVRGEGDNAQYKLAEAPSKDSWDSWNNDRDHTIRDAQSWSNTNRYYVGSEDLDAYGRWETVPDYGPVWAPVAGPGWAPYRSGRWVWEPGWGWTWVSYEPWGWAPYHYGRWFVYNSSWVWWPGPAYGYPGYRPIWAPAYVSFFGFGGGVGVGFGFGSVGWLPIGPCDTFYPWYGGYRSRYNVTNINVYNGRGRGFGGIAPLRRGGAYSNLRLATTNQRVREGISTVPTGRFGTGRSTPVAVNREAFSGGRRIEGNLPVVPTRAALSVSDRPAAASTLPRAGERQQFFSKTRPAARPQSFDREVAQMQRSIQRSGAESGQGLSRGDRAGQNSVNSTGAGRDAMARPASGVRAPASGGLSHGASAQQTEGGASARDNQHVGSVAASNQSQGQPQTRGTLSSAAGNGGWRKFSNTNPAQREGGMGRSNGSASSSGGPRSENSSRSNASSGDEGWRHFTPQSGGNVQGSDRMNGGSMNGRSDFPARNGISGPDRGSVGGRDMERESPRSYSRPPLEMRQPIVTPRGYDMGGGSPRMSAPSRSGGGGGGGGGYHGGSGGGGGGNHGGSGGGGSRGGSGGGSHGGSGRH
ncbi:MAG: DUF6600 domain-containing protein [Terriglobales bacterium]